MAATGATRSFLHQTRSYLHSPFTPLLFFVPLGLVSAHQDSGAINPLLVFALNGLGIIIVIFGSFRYGLVSITEKG
jgi:hypothetical protein